MDDVKFEREDRYAVFKFSDMDEAQMRILQDTICRLPRRECVVVESDWPEYGPVWQMIEDRVKGKQPEFVSSEVLCEHSGCGQGPQSNQLSFTIYRGDKLVMHRGKLGHAYAKPKVTP